MTNFDSILGINADGNSNYTQYRKNPTENFIDHHSLSEKSNRNLKLQLLQFDGEEEMLPHQYFELKEEFRNGKIQKSRAQRNTELHKAKMQLESNCEGKGITYQDSSIVCNHLASSVDGLRVKLNPNVDEYKTDAVKNNFIGFKYLVHSPYDFPFVEEVGKAMGPSIQSHIGFLGFHSWITDNADAYHCNPFQCPKKCASKHDIPLDVFQDYTRANCVFECQAKSTFENCGCLPYHYPEFHLLNTGIWKNVTSTACNHTQLICLSRVKGI